MTSDAPPAKAAAIDADIFIAFMMNDLLDHVTKKLTPETRRRAQAVDNCPTIEYNMQLSDV